ncbi:MAG: T4 RnlA family RNA ligase [Chitinophagales bacterium]|nr:T4 RnlA family RNA ligase [Chitinophagales bacterium]
MLEVQKFLNACVYEQGMTRQQALAELTSQFAIKVKHYEEDGIVLLDYHTLDSPKLHPVVIECRSLILQFNTFGVVSRKFDRFFNYGEALDYYHDFDLSRSVIMEKADGSLIGVYHHNGKWHISTRGMAFAEGEHAMGGTFRDKVLDAFGMTEEEFQTVFSVFNKSLTFVLEYTSPENRIVTKYEKPEMVLLSANDGEKEWDYDTMYCNLIAYGVKNIRKVKTYSASCMDAVVQLANSLPDLQEGFVIYDPVSNKRMKVKSSLYVVAHAIRGNDPLPTKKNLLNLLFTGELDEFIAYFPEWTEKAEEVRSEVLLVQQGLAEAWNNYHQIEDQKEFALSIKNVKHNGILFQARKAKTDITEVWKNLDIQKKINMFL